MPIIDLQANQPKEKQWSSSAPPTPTRTALRRSSPVVLASSGRSRGTSPSPPTGTTETPLAPCSTCSCPRSTGPRWSTPRACSVSATTRTTAAPCTASPSTSNVGPSGLYPLGGNSKQLHETPCAGTSPGLTLVLQQNMGTER